MGSAASRNRYLSLNLVPGEINFFLENEKKKLLFFELEVSYFKGLSFLAVISTIIFEEIPRRNEEPIYPNLLAHNL